MIVSTYYTVTFRVGQRDDKCLRSAAFVLPRCDDADAAAESVHAHEPSGAGHGRRRRRRCSERVSCISLLLIIFTMPYAMFKSKKIKIIIVFGTFSLRETIFFNFLLLVLFYFISFVLLFSPLSYITYNLLLLLFHLVA